MQKQAFSSAADEWDAAWVLQALNGSDEAFDLLTFRMMPLMRRLATQYGNLPGMDTEDLLQEGLLALLTAIRAYQASLGAFYAFAASCIRNRMLSVVRRTLSDGNAQVAQPDELLDAIADEGQVDPATLVVEQEEAQRLYCRLQKRLSTLEYRVLTAHLAGKSYKEIADELSVTEKTVDNALQRIRKKLSEKAL